MGLNPAKVWNIRPPRLQRAFDQQKAPRILPGPDEPPAVHLTGRERSCRNALDKFLYMPRCFADVTDGRLKYANLQHHGHNIANDLQLL
ncbi:hypothetical protein QR685DRAFT_572452 [Neurospora intermedia]|uniref:Uncharacterized protein n=1 Tax=Neurospora intermedia TaxID=5142 RepID=A0ABR3DCG7_NEUIN